jgi:hypothetical protein
MFPKLPLGDLNYEVSCRFWVFSAFLCVSAQDARTASVPGSIQTAEQRIADIIGRMTLEEKAQQLNHLNAGIPRLKVALETAETKHITIALPESQLSYYDVTMHEFIVAPGTFKVMIGSSAEDIRLSTDLETN